MFSLWLIICHFVFSALFWLDIICSASLKAFWEFIFFASFFYPPVSVSDRPRRHKELPLFFSFFFLFYSLSFLEGACSNFIFNAVIQAVSASIKSLCAISSDTFSRIYSVSFSWTALLLKQFHCSSTWAWAARKQHIAVLCKTSTAVHTGSI